MTVRDIYEYALVELNKLNAPSLLLEDYNYFINKAIQQYINLVYAKSEIDQQSTDDIRVLKTSTILEPKLFSSSLTSDKTKLLSNGLFKTSYYADLPTDYIGQIIQAISANGIKRNLSILGGEPLAEQNLDIVLDLLCKVVIAYPKIDIYLWTGYYIEDLIKENDPIIIDILNNINFLIDGPYIKELRDITLRYMGSSNQRFIEMPLTFIEKNGTIYIDYKNKENNNGSDFED